MSTFKRTGFTNTDETQTIIFEVAICSRCQYESWVKVGVKKAKCPACDSMNTVISHL